MGETRGAGPQYHYDPEERLEGRSFRGDRERSRGGAFRRNKSLLLILLDIVLVIFIFGLYRFVLVPRLASTQFEGYELELRAFSYGDEVLVSLRIEPLEEEISPVSAEVIFTLEPSGDSRTVSRVFPAPTEGEVTIRVGVPVGEGAEPERVRVDIVAGDRDVQLYTDVTPE